jgi:hypothetical protein
LGTAATKNASRDATSIVASVLLPITNGNFARFNATDGTVEDAGVAPATYLSKADNLSSVANPDAAYENLGGGTMGKRDVHIQSGGSPSGGSDGDIFLIYS